MAVATILVTGPARGLVGGQSRHLDVLALVAARLDCALAHVEIGRRGSEDRRTATPLRLLRDYRQLASKLIQTRAANAVPPLVLHVNSSVQYASLLRDLVFVAIGRLLGADLVVVQFHGCELADPSDRRPVLRLLARLAAAAADRLVVLSRSQARAIGGAATTAEVIPNAILLQTPVLRRAASPATRPLRLLYLARMIPQKGPLLCLQAAALLRDRGIHVELTLAGEGPLLHELPSRVRELRLENRVVVAGAVPSQQVRSLLAKHDLLWAPSIYAEGQPYSLIEALEAGLPVLACVPNAAMREMVDACAGAVLPVEPDAQALAAATASLAATAGGIEHLQDLARQVAGRRHSLEAALPRWKAAWSLPSSAPSKARLPAT